jgi:hypothetical protein
MIWGMMPKVDGLGGADLAKLGRERMADVAGSVILYVAVQPFLKAASKP